MAALKQGKWSFASVLPLPLPLAMFDVAISRSLEIDLAVSCAFLGPALASRKKVTCRIGQGQGLEELRSACGDNSGSSGAERVGIQGNY